MFDTDFFKKTFKLKRRIIAKDIFLDTWELYNTFENLRNKEPFVFNIETTNACNMKCIMCPRPKLMKRKIQYMDMKIFKNIITQITPADKSRLFNFRKFIQKEYSIYDNDKSENAFYFYTVSKSLTLHGYGEPLLDPYIIDRIDLCSRYGIPTYFSCVPANIDVEKVIKMMRAGLGVIKFSMDALDDKSQKKIRGNNSNFSDSYRKICDLIKIKSKDHSIKTEIVIIMLELGKGKKAAETLNAFLDLWKNQPVYAYIKSQDNRWFYEQDPNLIYKSHYAMQYCEFPWTSMTIMSDGSVVPCTQDYNCEIVFGNVKNKSLKEIWNSQAYDNFRKWHIAGKFPKNFKCVSRCDLKLVYDRLKGKRCQNNTENINQFNVCQK